MDTLRRVRSWKLPGWMVVQHPVEAGLVTGFLSKVCSRPQRIVHACGHAGPARTCRLGVMLFSIAFFSQQSWSGLIMTLPADIFPLSAVGSVSGLIGFGGAIGGAIFGVVAGFLLGHGFGYGTLFFIVGTFTSSGFLPSCCWEAGCNRSRFQIYYTYRQSQL